MTLQELEDEMAEAEAYTPRVTALEERADVAALDQLHHERRVLLDQLAPLQALHGNFGLWDDRRKALLEACKVRAYMQLLADGQGKKAPPAHVIESQAYADQQYLAFLDTGERERIEYIRMNNQLTEIEEKIRSREIELLAFNAELRLQR